MAFPITFLDAEDIGREVRVNLHGGVDLLTTVTGIHIVTVAGGDLEVSIDTADREGLVLQPDSYVFYADSVARV